MADIVLPAPGEDEEYVLVKKPRTLLQSLRAERDTLIAELASMVEPENVELRELGKTIHPYSIKEERLKQIRTEIREITGGD